MVCPAAYHSIVACLAAFYRTVVRRAEKENN
eukprot:CAMPEP_0195081876 /NCGR_PEP_ID=MMETSP0448-20130528/23214_1 /TAXON_ID=66468 /ORGANISM="Heterocapsa triquestra, Strain CCMP 448" /LENGTH=30 /DNA_ID= /DNA_START= /DNA_END= /DNA_ORIENTATION=